jgi:DNA-directed RNA polymerase specialized sigma subunit
MVEMTRYHATASPVGRFWHIEVREIARATQARHASEIPAMARDLVEIMTGEANVDLEVEYVLPSEIEEHRRRAAALRREELRLRQEAARELRAAAAALRQQGLTLADVGTVLGVSHQRASQLLAAHTEAVARAS